MISKLKNLLNNYKKYGKLGVLRFYFNNIVFGGQIEFNTFLLVKYLFKESLKKNKYFIRERLATFGLIPVISVIMSVYNDERYLKKSINSILAQDFKNFEFLILDDGSNDSSFSILKKYAKEDKRIKIYRNKRNIGLTKSLNILLRKARGLFIARMDSDDISLPRRLAEEYKFLTENKEIFLTGTRINHINSIGNITSSPILPVSSSEISEILPVINCIYHPTIMFRNEGYKYREKFIYAQDYDFYLNLLSFGKKFYNLEEILLLYRITKSSLSNRKGVKQKIFAEKAKEFYFERMNHEVDSYNSFTCDF